MIDWREQEVRNETSSREINEWIDDANQHSGLPADPFVCECSDASCPSTITLTHLEYEGVRAHATYFAIATDHETPDLDAMVSEHAGVHDRPEAAGDAGEGRERIGSSENDAAPSGERGRGGEV